MNRTVVPGRATAIAAFLLATGVPILARIYLRAPIGIFAIVFLSIPIVGLGYVSRSRRDTMPWIAYLSVIVNVVAAALVMVGILITPLSAYRAWFESFRYGTPDGGVSNIFVLLIGYYASVLAPTMLTMGLLWPVMMISFVLLFLLAIVVQTQAALVVVLGFLIIPAAYLATRSVARVRRENVFAFSLALIGTACVVAMAIPGFDTPPGDDFVNDRLYPNLRRATIEAFPQFPLLYTVPGYGISFDEKQLGAAPTLLPNPIFRVEGDPSEVLYLRTRIFDTYDGSSWSMSPYFAGRTTDALRSPFFGDPSEIGPDDLRIEITAKTFGFLPYTLDTDLIFVERGLPRITEGSADTGFQLQDALRQSDVIHLRRSETSQVARNPISDSERAFYLQIPDDLPPELRVIADGLSAGVDEVEQILTNIEVFLAQNYTYSLEIDDMMPGETGTEDFVYSFLFSQTSGYCVQFATSFIIIARLNGIPARYATGYLSYLPPDDRPAEITGLSAHAWPEVWIDGRGWVNWEATPAANIANYRSVDGDWVFDFGIDLNSTTTRQIESLIGSPVDEAQPAESVASKGLAGRITMFVLATLAGLSVAGVGGYWGFRGIRYLRRDDSGRFYGTARRLSRRLARRGVSLPERVGWITWFDEVDLMVRTPDASRRTDGVDIDAMKRLMMRVTYSEGPIAGADVESLADFARYVQRRVRHANGNGRHQTEEVTRST